MSIVTKEMVEAYAKQYGIDLSDGTQKPGVIGALEDWVAGRGEMNAFLTDAVVTRELFAPIREAYFRAHGVEMPPYSQNLNIGIKELGKNGGPEPAM